jgi:hypothetical protein
MPFLHTSIDKKYLLGTQPCIQAAQLSLPQGARSGNTVWQKQALAAADRGHSLA